MFLFAVDIETHSDDGFISPVSFFPDTTDENKVKLRFTPLDDRLSVAHAILFYLDFTLFLIRLAAGNQ